MWWDIDVSECRTASIFILPHHYTASQPTQRLKFHRSGNLKLREIYLKFDQIRHVIWALKEQERQLFTH
jgi:hypothetical protein